MNKVITINLDGIAYQLEEGGYDALRAYLDTAAARLQGNPDREEIISDIERAIAEKFRVLLNNYKTVVITREVTAALAELGPVDAEGGAGEGTGPEPRQPGGTAGNPAGFGPSRENPAAQPSNPTKRLYRLMDGAMLAGVCNGLAAYADVDPTFIRLGFVAFTLLGGAGVLVYVVLALVVPAAHTPEEKASAAGGPATAQEFIRRAKEGYYEAMRNFPDPRERREWARRFKREMRANARQWRHEWRHHRRHHWWGHWGPPPPSGPGPVHPGMGLTLPLLSSLSGIISLLFICAIISLLATGSVFGLAIPGHLPVWAAAVIMLFIYGFLKAPLRAARRTCQWSLGQSPGTGSLLFLMDAIIWMAIVFVILCLAIHYFPELRAAIDSLPAVVHQAADDIRSWWKGT